MADPGGVYRLGDTEVVAFTSTSTANSTAIHAGVSVVRVFATTNCHIKIGSSPTATASDAKISPGVEYYYAVTQGQKVAAIRTATSGTLYVTEVS